jgi:hypothetical protein
MNVDSFRHICHVPCRPPKFGSQTTLGPAVTRPDVMGEFLQRVFTSIHRVNNAGLNILLSCKRAQF